MIRRVLVGAVATAAVAAATVAPAASAEVRPFEPPVRVVGGCLPGSAASVTTQNGTVRGFVECDPGGPRIRFVSRNPDGSVPASEDTGFSGWVLAAAYDSTGTYVLFFDARSIRIGKRTNAGTYSSRAVDTWRGAPPSGDVVARDGQWFGVWSKQTGPGGEVAQTELHQAGTAYPLRRITTTAPTLQDLEPTLAYSGTTPVLVWTRLPFRGHTGPSDLMVAKLLGGGWQSRVFASAGTHNTTPDMAIVGGRTFVTWVRDGRVVVAGNRGGAFSSRTFNTGGFAPRVAASTSLGGVNRVFLAWTTIGGTAASQVFFAETTSPNAGITGPWSGARVTGPQTTAVGVGDGADRVRVVFRGPDAVYVTAQR